MSLSLPKPALAYDARDQAQLRRALEQEDRNNRKLHADVEIGSERLILKSPNGSRWSLAVSNTGALTTVAL